MLCAVPAPVAALSGEARNSTFCKVASGPARRVLRQAFDGAARWPEKIPDRRKLYRSTLKSRSGGRRYQNHILSSPDLDAVRQCIRAYLGL